MNMLDIFFISLYFISKGKDQGNGEHSNKHEVQTALSAVCLKLDKDRPKTHPV